MEISAQQLQPHTVRVSLNAGDFVNANLTAHPTAVEVPIFTLPSGTWEGVVARRMGAFGPQDFVFFNVGGDGSVGLQMTPDAERLINPRGIGVSAITSPAIAKVRAADTKQILQVSKSYTDINLISPIIAPFSTRRDTSLFDISSFAQQGNVMGWFIKEVKAIVQTAWDAPNTPGVTLGVKISGQTLHVADLKVVATTVSNPGRFIGSGENSIDATFFSAHPTTPPSRDFTAGQVSVAVTLLKPIPGGGSLEVILFFTS